MASGNLNFKSMKERDYEVVLQLASHQDPILCVLG